MPVEGKVAQARAGIRWHPHCSIHGFHVDPSMASMSIHLSINGCGIHQACPVAPPAQALLQLLLQG